MCGTSVKNLKYAFLCFVNVAALTVTASVITAVRRRPSRDTPEMIHILINANTLQFVKDKTRLVSTLWRTTLSNDTDSVRTSERTRFVTMKKINQLILPLFIRATAWSTQIHGVRRRKSLWMLQQMAHIVPIGFKTLGVWC